MQGEKAGLIEYGRAFEYLCGHGKCRKQIFLRLPPYIWVLCCLWVLSSCLAPRATMLSSDAETTGILCSQSIDIVDRQHADDYSALLYNLRLLFVSRATDPKRFSASFSAWLYRLNQKYHLRKTLGRPYTAYDSAAVKQTQQKLRRYLFHQGYLRAEVQPQVTHEGECVDVVYRINLGRRYRIWEVHYEVLDTALERYGWYIEQQSLLKRGQPVTLELFEAERNRVTTYLRNRGFADFHAGYIVNQPADTVDGKVRLRIQIKPPAPDSSHQRYRIGKVYVQAEYHPEIPFVDTVRLADNYLLAYPRAKKRWIQPSILRRKIQLFPGKYYSQDSEQATFSQLNNLPAYDFVSINKAPRNGPLPLLDYEILLTPNKKYAFGADFNIAYSTVTSSVITRSTNSFTIGLSSTFENRNLWYRGIYSRFILDGELEFSPFGRDSSYFGVFSLYFNSRYVMRFPTYVEFPGTIRLLYNSRLISSWFFQHLQQRAHTEVQVNVNNIFHPRLFRIFNAQADVGFNWKVEQTAFTIRTSALAFYLGERTGTLFDSVIIGEFQRRSILGNYLLTSLFFNSLKYSYLGKHRPFGFLYKGKGSLEMSGMEILLANSLWYSTFQKELIPTRLYWRGDSVELSSFARLSVEWSIYYSFGGRHTIAMRLAPAIAYSFGDKIMPYPKQFYVGGPYSIRAWPLRAIGPGRKFIDFSPAVGYYAAGDVKLDLSIEYRFPLSAWIYGATFIDAGNVWELKSPDAERRFSLDNLTAMAVGTGFGIRFDFTFFILRLDLGLKLLTPYTKDGTRWYYNKSNPFPLHPIGIFREIQWNIAIGYPY